MDERELKEWFFKENIRLTEEREQLEKEQNDFNKRQHEYELEIEKKQALMKIEARRLEMERELFEKKLEILEIECRRLGNDRAKLDKEKADFEEVKKYRRNVVHNVTYVGADFLFKGVDSEIALKKRYRELLKIFHPDNIGGDTDAIQDINRKYDSLKRMYG